MPNWYEIVTGQDLPTECAARELNAEIQLACDGLAKVNLAAIEIGRECTADRCAAETADALISLDALRVAWLSRVGDATGAFRPRSFYFEDAVPPVVRSFAGGVIERPDMVPAWWLAVSVGLALVVTVAAAVAWVRPR